MKYGELNILKQFGSVSKLKDVVKEDPTYITRIQGLQNLKRTSPPVGRSLKSVLKKMFSRYKRDISEVDKLILKRPAIFENISHEVSLKSKDNLKPNRKISVPRQNIPKTYYQAPNTPSPFYEVPPPTPANTPSPFYQVPVNTPSSFYDVPAITPSSFYEVPPPFDNVDSSLDPATVVQMLQQEGSNLQSAQTDSSSSSGSAGGQKNSVILSKPSAIALIDSGTVSLQSLPAVDVSISSNTASLSSASSVNRVSTLSGNSALLAALGLALIPTLAVSIPFLVPSLRRGRFVETESVSGGTDTSW